MIDEKYVLKQLNEQREHLAGALVRGVNSWDEYRWITGQIRGLQFSIEFIDDHAKKLEQEE
jgi:hypothetical protein